jgi:diguanylate cyclase (GGDEF)-like protein/PAS domain S-box-containing protein
MSRTGPKLDNLFDVLQGYAPEVRNLACDYRAEHGTVFEHHQIEIRKGTKGTEAILSLTLLKLSAGQLMAVLQDVTTMVRQERELRSREQRLQAIFDGVRDYAIYSLDRNGRIETWNKSAERVEGFTSAEAIGQDYGLDYPAEGHARAQIGEMLQVAARVGWHEDEGWRVRRGGERFWASTMVSVMRESEDPHSRAQGFSVITRDITERKVSEDKLRRLAATDYLTGAYNRRYFFDNAAAAADRCAAQGQPVSVMTIDADHFKELNDSYGHAYGDRALKTMAAICLGAVAPGDIVARFGGEEFALLLLNQDLGGARAVAERIRVSLEAAGLGLTASFGVAGLQGAGSPGTSSQGDDIEDALREADNALYRAKALGRDRVCAA